MKEIKFLVLDVDGTLTDGGIYITEKGEQFKKFNSRDGLGIKEAMKKGVEVAIISHSMSSAMIDTRANMLGIKYLYIGQRSKKEVLQEWMEELQLERKHIAYIGDDINDLDVMSMVDFTACPSDSIREIKDYVDVVLENSGGHGAVREFIDRFILSN